MKRYYAVQTQGWGRCQPLKKAENVIITEVTDDRVKGERISKFGGGTNFNVKRDGEKFSVGSGSSKQRYLLRSYTLG